MLMAGTINLMFSRMEEGIASVDAEEIGSFKRTAALEKLLRDLPLFLVMSADLAMMIEDMTTPATTVVNAPTTVAVNTDTTDAKDADGKGMYL